MSWYNNNNESTFIDATQQLTGGGSSTITILNEPTITDGTNGDPTTTIPELNTGFDTTLNDLINIRQDGNNNFQVYINNANDNGEIRFYTKNAMNINDFNYSYFTFSYSEPRLTYNSKINANGYLQYYHTYHLAYPQKLSGWYTVDFDISALETAQNLIGVGLATAQGEIGILTTDLGLLNTDYFAFKGLTVTNIADLYNLIHGLYTSGRGGLAGWRRSTETRDTLGNIFTSLGGVVDRSTNLGGSFVLPSILRLQGSRLAFLTTFVNRFQNAITYATIGAGIYGIYNLIDKEYQDNANDDLLTVQRLRLDIEDNVANGDTSSQVVEHIFIDYLTIDATTNNGFITAGVYEYVGIGNDATLAIQIKDNGSGTLIAEIISIMEMGSGFSVNDEIFINKSDIGGSTGQLKIVVSQLASYAYILEQEEIKASARLNEVNNRIRRRQFIPDKNNFGDGLNIVETDITEPSGEITKDLDISLKIDNSQFQYDATGNLQLTNYSKIAQNTLRISQINNEIGDNTATPKTGLYALIAGLQTNLNNTNANVSTNAIQIANNKNNIEELQGIVSGTTGNVNDVWEIILPDGTNYMTNTSYKMDLGYKEQFAGFPINLITLAYKTTPTILNTDETGLDILGFYPSLERIDDADNIELVKTIGLNINNDYSFEKGLLYLDNTDPLIDYDLSRNVEIIIFLKPYDLSSTTEEYHILQTGIELAPDEYDIDNNKLKIGIKDNKLQITHNVKRTFQYYPVNFTNDIRSTQTAGLSYVSTSTDSTIQLVYTNAIGREYFFGVDDLNEVNNLIKAQQIDAVTDYFTSIYYFDMFFNEILPQGYSTTVWTSPIHYYEEDPYDTATENIGAIRLHYEYMVMDTPTSLAIDSFTSTTDLQNSLELQLRINVKQRGSNTVLHTRTYDFNQIEYSITTGTPAYTQTFYVPAVYPELAGSTRYSRIEFELVHKGSGYTPLPIGTQSYKFYSGQHAIRIYHIEYFKYDTSLTTFYDHTPVTFQSINPIPVFPTPIQFNEWHKLVINMRLDNKILNYYVNDVYYMFSFISELINIQLQAPNLDPNAGFFFTAQYEFTNYNQNTLTRDNNILIFGNQPSQGALHFTHFNYRFLQLETTPYFNQTERDKLDELINYNFYHESVEVPRYLKVKEFYGDVCEFRKILNNGISLYQELPPAEQTQLLSNTSSDNVLSANFNVPINNLYSLTTDNAGYLHYNNTTKSVELLKNAIDLNALSATSLRMNDKEELIFEHIIDGSSFSVRVASRSRTSLSEFFRLRAWEGNYVGTQSLDYLDPPYPTHIYTLTETQITRNLPNNIIQYETWESGQLQDPALNPYNPNGFSPIPFNYQLISGDVIKFKCDPSANGFWGLYYVDYATLNPPDADINVIPTFSDLTLIKLMNNGDDFRVDARKYKYPFYEVYLVYNQDITKAILLIQNYPETYIDSILTGTVLELNSATNVAKNENPMRFEFNAFGALKGCRLTIKADERPIFTTGKIVTTNGRPAVPDDFYKFDFAVNYSTFAQFYESGDLITTGNIYVDADINGVGSLDLPIMVNRIDNLKSPQEFAITGLPALADQVFHFVIESFNIANATIYFTGTDRVNTYNNQYVNQFELYYDDVLKITLSPIALFQYNQNPLSYNFAIGRPYPLSTQNLSTLINSNPQQLYVRMEKRGDSKYEVFELLNAPRQIILSNVVDYVNPDFLPTDVYALEYLPYSNTYRWKQNYIVDSSPQPVGIGQTLSVPTGSFSVRESTNEISSRRTLSSLVPIEKVSQITTYNVFNGEVEFNNNVILENVNTDIGVLFTIYTNKNKRDPVTQVDNFKDKSSIILDDGSHEWIFLRDPNNLEDPLYSTLFKHGTNDILRLKYNEVICYKQLNVSSDGIKFSDNTILTSTSQITTNSANITSLQSTVSTNDLNSSNYTFSVEEKADANESQINILINTVTVQASLIQDNANDIIALQGDVATNTGNISNNSTAISNNSTAISNNSTAISNNSTNISTLQSQVTGLLSPSAVSVPLTYDAGVYQSSYTKVVPTFNSSFTPYYTTSGITIDYTNHRLVINTTGTYRISYNLNFRNKRSVRSIIVSALYKNGAILGGSENQSSYLRFFNWTSSNSISFISSLSSGDYLELYTYGYGDSGGGYVELLGGASIITLDQIA